QPRPRAQPRPPARPRAPPGDRAVRPLDRHPDRAPAAQDRGRSRQAAGPQDRARRRLHVREHQAVSADEDAQFQEAGEAQLRATLDTMPARVAFVARQRRHRYVNQEYASLIGKPAHEMIGRTVAEIMGGETFDRLRTLGERALAGETVRWEGWIDYPRAG